MSLILDSLPITNGQDGLENPKGYDDPEKHTGLDHLDRPEALEGHDGPEKPKGDDETQRPEGHGELNRHDETKLDPRDAAFQNSIGENKNVPWYQKTLGKMEEPARELLENYSKISAETVDSHVLQVVGSTTTQNTGSSDPSPNLANS